MVIPPPLDTAQIEQSVNQPAKRINYQFRLLYAIAIVFVVMGHSGNGGINIFFDWFTPYAFHLGIFAFGSGYFYKSLESNNQYSYFKRKINHLMVPFFLCNIFYGFLVLCSKQFGIFIGGDFTLNNLLIAPLYHGHQFVYNLATWFVVPLFVLVIVNNLLFKCFSFVSQKREIILFVIYLIFGVLSIKLSRMGYNTDWYLLVVRTMFLMPMFGLGLLYKKYHFLDSVNTWLYLFVVMLLQYPLLVYYGGPMGNNIAWMTDFKGGMLLPFCLEFLGILFWLRIAKVLEPIAKNSYFINEIGSHTFEIMTHHLLAMFLVKSVIAFVAVFVTINFNFYEFTHNIWYYYCPKGIWQSHFFYTIAGVTLPLLYVFIKKKLINAFPLNFS